MDKNNKYDIFTKIFIRLFGFPTIFWILLSLVAMLPSDDSEPITWFEFVLIDTFVIFSWFMIAYIISKIITMIINRKNKSQNDFNENKVIIKETNNTQTKENVKKEEIVNVVPKFKKIFMIILFIITLLSIQGALLTFILISANSHIHSFNFFKTTWVFWLWLPIPILSIILGFKYKKIGLKCTKNIIGGFIIAFFLIIYGSFWLVPSFNINYNEIDNYRDFVDAKIPSKGELTIDNYEHYSTDKKNYSIITAYFDKEDDSELLHSIEYNDHWMLNKEIKSNLKLMLPIIYQSSDDIYYSIYNKTLDDYNIALEAPGIYEIYATKYDKVNKILEIHHFYYTYK